MKNGVITNNNEAAEIAEMYRSKGQQSCERLHHPDVVNRYFNSAAQWWGLAAALSIGHNRTQRYEECADKDLDSAKRYTELYTAVG